jgi:hypothetical protein
MAIPKNKLAILIAGLKPKKGGDEEPPADEGGDGEDYEQKLDSDINAVADAIVGGKRDAIVQALRDLVDCITEADEQQDAEDMGGGESEEH